MHLYHLSMDVDNAFVYSTISNYTIIIYGKATAQLKEPQIKRNFLTCIVNIFYAPFLYQCVIIISISCILKMTFFICVDIPKCHFAIFKNCPSDQKGFLFNWIEYFFVDKQKITKNRYKRTSDEVNQNKMTHIILRIQTCFQNCLIQYIYDRR